MEKLKVAVVGLGRIGWQVHLPEIRKNDKYDFGERIAADIGGEVKEWEIDIWISHDNPQLPDFAWIGYHKDMEIYYIDQYYDQNISDILEETKKYDHYIFG